MNILYILVHKYFLKRALQVLFFPLLFLVLAWPQLTAEAPSPFFTALKNLLLKYGCLILPMILVLGVFIIWLIITFDFSRWLQQQGGPMRFNTRQYVHRQWGGNGLATAPLPYQWFLGWMTDVFVNPNEDCAVVNGKTIIRKPQKLYKSLAEQVEIKHVLLYPEPRKGIRIEKAMSSDNWPVTLTISIKYEVADPVRVAGLADPIGELDELIQGALIDYVGQYEARSFTGNQAHLKQVVLEALTKSKTLKIFRVIEVLNAQPHIPEEAIKPIRDISLEPDKLKRAEEERKRILLEAQTKADATHIESLPLFQQELIKLKLQLGMDAYLRLTQVIESATKANETSPEKVLEVIKNLGGILPGVINNENTHSNPKLIEAPSNQLSRREREEEEIEKRKRILNIQDFRVNGRGEQIKDAEVKLPQYTIRLECDSEYPKKPPHVKILWSGKEHHFNKNFHWQDDWFLVDVITYIVALDASTKMQNK